MTSTERLTPVPLREMWPHEAADFTPWLADNIDLLGEALDMVFEEVTTEAAVGGFSADVVAVNGDAETVLIENLLAPSDHGHIGQLITYAAGLRADYAVLIAESIRDEHRTALGWLNDNARDDGTRFFGIEVAAWRIGDSVPAPQLRVAVEPDDWRRAVRATSDNTGRGAAYASFWTGLLPLLHEAEPRWRGTKTPRPEGMLSFKSAIPSVKYLPRFGRSGLNIQAYIDSGDTQSTSEIYDWLHDRRDDIEQAFGADLAWHPSTDNRRAAYIEAPGPHDAQVDDTDTWPELWAWITPTMARLADAIDPHLR